MTLDIEKVELLLKLVDHAGLSELEIAEDGFRLVLSRNTSAVPGPTASPSRALPSEETELFHAPLAGVFYAASEPGASPFVQEGCEIEVNASLCVIEAMKTLNTITAPRAGRIVRVLVEDGASVDPSTPLFEIRWWA